MVLRGTLKSWNDDRGFGFIAPEDGGRELFVHIGSFPRDGSRPTIGEELRYELGKGEDGRPQAVWVYREAQGPPPEYAWPTPRVGRKSPAAVIIGLVLLAGVAVYGFDSVQQRARDLLSLAIDTVATQSSSREAGATYVCDGRTHCSQMTSCAEATYFLDNCPNTKMDGDNDGVPCEKQWCTSWFAE